MLPDTAPTASPRPTAIRLAALLTCAGLLGGCGFDYPTDRDVDYGPAAEERESTVDVLGAVIVAGEPDQGVFAASLYNGDRERARALETVVPTDDVSPLDPLSTSVIVPAGDLVNMFDRGGIPVIGDFRAGDFVDVALRFADGQVTTMNVEVVTPCYEYSLLGLPAIDLPGASDESVRPTEPVEGDLYPELGEGPGEYTCEVGGATGASSTDAPI